MKSRRKKVGGAAANRARIEKITPHSSGVLVELSIGGKSLKTDFKASRSREELRKVLPEGLVDVLEGDRKVEPADSRQVLKEISSAYGRSVADRVYSSSHDGRSLSKT